MLEAVEVKKAGQAPGLDGFVAKCLKGSLDNKSSEYCPHFTFVE